VDGYAKAGERQNPCTGEREVFEVPEFRLSFTCDRCGTEFIFSPDSRVSFRELPCIESRRMCPICCTDLKQEKDGTILYQALARYQEFYWYTLANKNKLSLRLVVTTPEPKATDEPGPAADPKSAEAKA
jgi:hypothetical protein